MHACAHAHTHIGMYVGICNKAGVINSLAHETIINIKVLFHCVVVAWFGYKEWNNFFIIEIHEGKNSLDGMCYFKEFALKW